MNIEQKLKSMEMTIDAATPGPLMGRTEEWGGEVIHAIYKGHPCKDGFAGRAPIAFVRSHADSWYALQARQDWGRCVKALKLVTEELKEDCMCNPQPRVEMQCNACGYLDEIQSILTEGEK